MADIELVITINENTWKGIRGGQSVPDILGSDIVNGLNAIKNGTPLPKHGDLIDKGKFKRWIETQDGDKLMTEYYLDALDMQETIIGGLHYGDVD